MALFSRRATPRLVIIIIFITHHLLSNSPSSDPVDILQCNGNSDKLQSLRGYRIPTIFV